MTDNELTNLLTELRGGSKSYMEEKHCKMVLRIIPETYRKSAFCVEAKVCVRTMNNWLNKHPLFNECFGYALALAEENWYQELVDCGQDEDFNFDAWQKKGQIFAVNKNKIHLNVDGKASPWEQYQQIIDQAGNGDFTATEIKLLMESLNVGTRVFEVFKLQGELDKLKEDLNEMVARHGQHTVAIVKTEETN